MWGEHYTYLSRVTCENLPKLKLCCCDEELGYKRWKSVNLCDNCRSFGLLSVVLTAVFHCICTCRACQRLMVSCFTWCELDSTL